MVIVLDNTITQDDRKSLQSFLEKNHFHVNEIAGEEETIIGVVGKMQIDPRAVELLPGVKRVIPISKPYKMASREFKRDNSVIDIKINVKNNFGQTVSIGGKKVVAIAGPCAVESREQIMSIAHEVAASGAVMLRGGAFKPRTSPYAFQGLGEEGIQLLKEAGDKYGLPIVTEIVSSEHIPVMRDYVDVYQVGARNMQNFELLKRLGELGKPVILKRGLSATIEELLMSAEYLLSSGTKDVILCERGIRTYEKATRNTLDLSAIPVLRQLTHLPLIVDPSHAIGVRDKIPPMALAAIASGSDGIIVEVHCHPEKALSDGPQALLPEQFDTLMRNISILAPVVGRELARPKAPRAVRIASGKSSKKEITCAFAGSRGAFAQQAIGAYFGDAALLGEVTELPMHSFRDIFQAVSEGSADYAMVPIENSLAGSVYENYDNLSRFDDVQIVGAITMRIEHSLVAVKGASLESTKNVYSHPHAFPQCKDFLDAHPEWVLVDSVSTASAAEFVAKKGSLENAAIASRVASDYHGLTELASGIESDKRNYTRLVIIAPIHAEKGADVSGGAFGTQKASVIFNTQNKAGALYECLGVFQKHGVNLLRLESRPKNGEPWHYTFYADIEMPKSGGNTESLDELVKALRAVTANEEVRLLGVYTEIHA